MDLTDLWPERSRFWAKVFKTTYCWIWMGGRDKDNYGHFWLNGKTEKAHRVAYVLHYGTDPKESFVLHDCDNPPCVNPEHLFLGCALSNAQDRELKGRGADIRGENHPSTTLTEVLVRAIRDELKIKTQREVGIKYGLSQQCVSKLKTRERWGHI